MNENEKNEEKKKTLLCVNHKAKFNSSLHGQNTNITFSTCIN